MSSERALVAELRRLQLSTPQPGGGGTLPSQRVSRWLIAPLAVIGLALGFVALGAENLDLSPVEARLGLAAAESAGPVGQVFGYWAPDLWPAQVLPSALLARLEAGRRPTVGSVRWPAALAGIIMGLILARGMSRVLGRRASVLVALCWFGSLALLDRSAEAGVDLILGLTLIGAIDRLLRRGSDLVAGLWTSLSFLAGGWPPVLIVLLASLVLGRRAARLSLRLVLPPVATALAWAAWTVWSSSAEVMSAALALPLTQRTAWTALGMSVIALGLPWGPMGLLACSHQVRAGWDATARDLVFGWLQIAGICLIAGTIVPGLAPAARVAAIAGLAVLAAACLESVCAGSLSGRGRTMFFVIFVLLLALWLVVMIYGSFIWCVVISYYRPVGIATGLAALAVAALAWSAFAQGSSKRAVLCLVVMAAGLKLAHWGYYVPEWNYRRSQGPWGRAIAQWIPPTWTLYTTHDWRPDLAFCIRRRVRQLHSPHFLRIQYGPESKFVLLQPSEFENWPDSAPPISLVARFHDEFGGERILARTAGTLPPPFGPNLVRLGYAARGRGYVSGASAHR
jgi:hypothetical protein